MRHLQRKVLGAVLGGIQTGYRLRRMTVILQLGSQAHILLQRCYQLGLIAHFEKRSFSGSAGGR